MTAAAAERLSRTRSGAGISLAVLAVTQIFRGTLVMTIAGIAAPAAAAATRAQLDTIAVVGMAVDSALGGAADGDVRVEVEKGVFLLANSGGGDALTIADLGEACFVADDQTVAKTCGGGMRPIAGVVVDVDANGVWVDVGALPAVRRLTVPFVIPATELAAGTAIEVVSPVVGAISEAKAIVQTAIVTGGAVTLAVGVTAVDGLSVVLADAAAKGDVATDTPTAGHASTVVAVGSRIQVVPAAAFAGGGALNGYVEITY